tara:strand:- start:158 stop:730 length:573 start_codon:yes stop_codon:yes gene_type:complete
MRRILVLRGVKRHIPLETFNSAIILLSKLIKNSGITTVCWNGETFPENGDSFTMAIVLLKQHFPWLEFLFFESSAVTLRSLVLPRLKSTDDPFPFMTTKNTSFLDSDASIPFLVAEHNLAVLLPEGKGMLYAMRWLKERLRIHKLHFVVIGMDDTTREEIKELMKSYDELGATNSIFPKWTNAHIFDVPS